MWWSPNRDLFQPPKEWWAIGTGIGTLTPTIPAFTLATNVRAVFPSAVKIAVPLPNCSSTTSRYCPVAAVRRWQLELARRGYTGAALLPRLDNRGRIGAAADSPARARTVDDGRITQQAF